MKLLITILVAGCLAFPPAVSAIAVGQTDTFEDGTTQGWVVGLLGAMPPSPPANIADGGPQGMGDNFLKITSQGGGGPGSRLTVINVSQWTGNYTAAGITTIVMYLRNLGATDLDVRLSLSNGTDSAVTDAVFLPTGGEWTQVTFAVTAAALTVTNGDVDTLLSDVSELRIFHNPDPTFPGPSIVAMLGIDGVTALSIPAAPVLGGTAQILLIALLGTVALLGFRRGVRRAPAVGGANPQRV